MEIQHTSDRQQTTRVELLTLVQELFDALTRGHLQVTEGTVMTVGAPPYRRLDCDGRALAYVRARPRRRAVRIDISGLWVTQQTSPLAIRGAGGGMTLLIQDRSEIQEAARYLEETVVATREAHGRKRFRAVG